MIFFCQLLTSIAVGETKFYQCIVKLGESSEAILTVTSIFIDMEMISYWHLAVAGFDG